MSLNPEKAEERAAAREARKARRAQGKESDEDKRLRIASGVLKRLVKELAYNNKEIEKQEEKIIKLEADPNYDQSRLPQEKAVLEESKQMVPEVSKKIKEAVDNLAAMLKDETFIKAVTKGLEEAQALLDSHK